MTARLWVTYLPTYHPTRPHPGLLGAKKEGKWGMGVPRTAGLDTGDTAKNRSRYRGGVDPGTYCPHVATHLTCQAPPSALYVTKKRRK